MVFPFDFGLVDIGKAFPGTYFHAVKQKLGKKFDSLSVYLRSPLIRILKNDEPKLAKDTV